MNKVNSENKKCYGKKIKQPIGLERDREGLRRAPEKLSKLMNIWEATQRIL